MKKEISIALISDSHIGDENKPALMRAEKVLASRKFDKYINLGDIIDLPEISKFVEGRPGLKEGRRIINDINAGKKMLQRHIDIVKKKNPKCEIIVCGSNHDEERLADYAERYPELKGIIEWETLMDFKGMGVKFYPSAGKPYKFRDFIFLHGRKATKYPIAATLELYKCNCVIGHVHQMGTTVLPAYPKPLIGYSVGCLQRLHPSWQKEYVNRWMHSMAIMEFDGKGNHQFQHIIL